MLESGHTREAVLGYEVSYMLGFMNKRVEVLAARESAAGSPSARNKQIHRGKVTKTKTMTMEQMAAKAEAQKKG